MYIYTESFFSPSCVLLAFIDISFVIFIEFYLWFYCFTTQYCEILPHLFAGNCTFHYPKWFCVFCRLHCLTFNLLVQSMFDNFEMHTSQYGNVGTALITSIHHETSYFTLFLFFFLFFSQLFICVRTNGLFTLSQFIWTLGEGLSQQTPPLHLFSCPCAISIKL